MLRECMFGLLFNLVSGLNFFSFNTAAFLLPYYSHPNVTNYDYSHKSYFSNSLDCSSIKKDNQYTLGSAIKVFLILLCSNSIYNLIVVHVDIASFYGFYKSIGATEQHMELCLRNDFFPQPIHIFRNACIRPYVVVCGLLNRS